MSRLSVIVVSYNTREPLRRCLRSLGDADEAIVVDNASGDGSAEMVEAEFPSVRLIRNATNRGFGAANNQGLEAMTGDLALCLNSDAAAQPGALRLMVRVMDAHPDVVACGGRLQFPDGRLQESCCGALTLWALFCEQAYLERLFPRSALLSPYWLSRRLLSGPAKDTYDVEQVMGACLMLRTLERFDERFFLYCEDTELCRRLRKHGRIVYVPGAVFRHDLGSSSQERWEAVARYNRGKELYFLLHHGRFAAIVALLLDRFGALMRFLVWSVATVLTACTVASVRRKALLFLRVLTVRASGPPLPRDSAE